MSHVVIITQEFAPYIGGIATYCEQLSRAIARGGTEVTVVCPSYPGLPQQDAIDKELGRDRVAVKRIGVGSFSPSKLPGRLKGIRRLIASLRRASILAADLPSAVMLRLIKNRQRIDYSSTVYGSELIRLTRSRLVRVTRTADVYDECKRLIAVSRYAIARIAKAVPSIPAERVILTYMGVDRRWDPGDGQDKRSSPEKRTVVTVARIEERKGHHLAVEALSRLDGATESIQYLVVGPTTSARYQQRVERAARQKKVHCRFLGKMTQQEIIELYANTDVFLLPATRHHKRIEGFGLVFLEAGLSRVPSVATAIGGIPEAIENRQTGLLVAPGDVGAIARATSELLNDEPLRRAMGANARDRALTFTWDLCAARTLEAVL